MGSKNIFILLGLFIAFSLLISSSEVSARDVAETTTIKTEGGASLDGVRVCHRVCQCHRVCHKVCHRICKCRRVCPEAEAEALEEATQVTEAEALEATQVTEEEALEGTQVKPQN